MTAGHLPTQDPARSQPHGDCLQVPTCRARVPGAVRGMACAVPSPKASIFAPFSIGTMDAYTTTISSKTVRSGSSSACCSRDAPVDASFIAPARKPIIA